MANRYRPPSEIYPNWDSFDLKSAKPPDDNAQCKQCQNLFVLTAAMLDRRMVGRLSFGTERGIVTDIELLCDSCFQEKWDNAAVLD